MIQFHISLALCLTITNIIAECMAMGKSVLFVSEKMAALEVVKVRLEAAGLADFCLELHDNSLARAEVVARIDWFMVVLG